MNIHSTKTPIALLTLIILLTIITALLSFIPLPQPASTPAPTLADQIRTGAVPPPAYTPEVQQKLATGHGFQALISYTDTGFEPAEVTIHQGDTVRFTDNSSHPLWVAATGDAAHPLYPREQNDCGSSHLDSCTPLSPQDFWEFTFTQAGDWYYADNLDKAHTGVVVVQK